VEEFGSNSESHLDNMLIRLQKDPKYNLNPSYNINKYVAAGIMGYHREKVKHFKPFRDVVETIKKLRNKGIKTAIVTDGTPKKQYEKILRLKVENLFDDIIISDEVAIRKPNILLFELFCAKFNCSSSEAIYVGDRLDKDIEPAIQAGLHSVLIHRGTKHDPNINKIKSPIKPHFHINSLHELIAIIEKINT
jgi:putative hydrolase of the HAD superfamily